VRPRHAARQRDRHPIALILGVTAAGLPQASPSKAGVIGLTRDLALQWTGRKGIRDNAIAPGFFQTEMTDEYPDEYLQSQAPRLIAWRMSDPDVLTATAIWLVSAGGRVRHGSDGGGGRRHLHHLTAHSMTRPLDPTARRSRGFVAEPTLVRPARSVAYRRDRKR
jgi:Enoyl-(Acyl carrier protein) reductase